MLKRVFQAMKKAITWIEFERKTDVLAFAAFLLGLGGIMSQIVAHVRGPEVQLFAPHQVLFHCEERQQDSPIIRFSAIFAYTNTGPIGYNATIRRELLKYSISDNEYYQVWQKFVVTDVGHNPKKCARNLEIEAKGLASPFAVNAGASVSHETHFHPASTLEDQGTNKIGHANFVTFDAFDSMIGKVGDKPISMLFEFIAEISGESPGIAACRVQIDDDLRYWFRHKGWIAPRCWESEEQTEIRIDNI